MHNTIYINDFNKMKRLASLMIDSFDSQKEFGKCRKRYLAHMRNMLKRYGPNSDILASLADIYEYPRKAIPILLEAYNYAKKERNAQNLTYIAGSLCSRFLSLKPVDIKNAKKWCIQHSKNLKEYGQDSDFEEYIDNACEIACILKEVD